MNTVEMNTVKKMKNFNIQESEQGLRKVDWKALSPKYLREELELIQKFDIDPVVWNSATEFQRKVWMACLQIPKGCVATYSDIALAIGQPKAVRAVANALGKNAIAIRIPCHRVIGVGHLGGYSCPVGIKAKAFVLHEECI